MISELTQYLWNTLDQSEKRALASRPEGLLQLRSRRETLQRFKDQWSGQGDWKIAYIAWLPTDPAGDQGPGRILVGTRVAQAIHAVGGDKLATAYTTKTGKDCGCGKREKALNEADRKIRSAIKKVFKRV